MGHLFGELSSLSKGIKRLFRVGLFFFLFFLSATEGRKNSKEEKVCQKIIKAIENKSKNIEKIITDDLKPFKDNKQAMQWIRSYKPSADAPNFLFYALLKNNTSAFFFFLKNDFSIAGFDQAGDTLLIKVFKKKILWGLWGKQMINKLLDQYKKEKKSEDLKAYINYIPQEKEEDAALFCAIRAGYPAIIEVLLEKGANPLIDFERLGGERVSPLELAIEQLIELGRSNAGLERIICLLLFFIAKSGVKDFRCSPNVVKDEKNRYGDQIKPVVDFVREKIKKNEPITIETLEKGLVNRKNSPPVKSSEKKNTSTHFGQKKRKKKSKGAFSNHKGKWFFLFALLLGVWHYGKKRGVEEERVDEEGEFVEEVA